MRADIPRSLAMGPLSMGFEVAWRRRGGWQVLFSTWKGRNWTGSFNDFRVSIPIRRSLFEGIFRGAQVLEGWKGEVVRWRWKCDRLIHLKLNEVILSFEGNHGLICFALNKNGYRRIIKILLTLLILKYSYYWIRFCTELMDEYIKTVTLNKKGNQNRSTYISILFLPCHKIISKHFASYKNKCT